MAYFLGYSSSEGLLPIDLTNVDNDNILSIVEFTTNYKSEQELKYYLYNQGLIPTIETKLVYLIDKGKKGNKTYKMVNNTSKVYYSAYKDTFSRSHVYNVINENKTDVELIMYLYAAYLTKLGTCKCVYDKVKEFRNNPEECYKFINEINFNNYSKSTQIILNYIKEYIEKNGDALVAYNLNQWDYYFKELNQSLINDIEDVLMIFLKYKNEMKYTKITALTNLGNAFEVVDQYDEPIDGIEKLEEQVKNYLYNFIRYTIYKYDSKTKKLLLDENNQWIIKPRDLFDLASIINSYEDYLIKTYVDSEEEQHKLELKGN